MGDKTLEFYKSGNLVLPLFLLKRYKELNISLEEFIILMFLYQKGNKTSFDINNICDNLGFDKNNILTMIGNLTEKNLIKVEVEKNEKNYMEEIVILDGFYEKIKYLIVEDSVNKDNNIDSNIYEIIEKEFGRTLSPMEYEIIKGWLSSNYKEELIKEALKEATFNGVSNLRYIDKILYEWDKKNIRTIDDVVKNRKKRKKELEEDPDIDMNVVDWDWLDD